MGQAAGPVKPPLAKPSAREVNPRLTTFAGLQILCSGTLELLKSTP